MPLHDAFAHIGLPRFLGAEEFLRIMDDNDVDAAVVCTAETCPDLDELSCAQAKWPDRFRAVGIAIGATPQECLDNARQQLDAGLVGIRVSASTIVAQPALLELIGQAHATPYVFGPDLFGEAALLIADFLDRFPNRVVCAPHFAGVASADGFDQLPHAQRLLDHPQFLVVFCRQGAHAATGIGSVAKFLVQHVGWDRIMWGSEYPVCLWRNESYQTTRAWIDGMGLKPTEAQRKAFFSGNARNHLFRPRHTPVRELGPEWDLRHLKKHCPVWLFPRTAIDLPEETHRTLLLNYLARGGDKKMPYAQFIASLLSDSARRLEG